MPRDPLNGRELADKLGVPDKALRRLIRKHRLMPGHVQDATYEIYPDDEARIAAHPAVRALIARSRTS